MLSSMLGSLESPINLMCRPVRGGHGTWKIPTEGQIKPCHELTTPTTLLHPFKRIINLQYLKHVLSRLKHQLLPSMFGVFLERNYKIINTTACRLFITLCCSLSVSFTRTYEQIHVHTHPRTVEQTLWQIFFTDTSIGFKTGTLSILI